MSSIILIKRSGDRNLAGIRVEGEPDTLAITYSTHILLSWMQAEHVYEASTEKTKDTHRAYIRIDQYHDEPDSQTWHWWESGHKGLVCDQGLIERFGFLPDRIYIRQLSTIEDYEKSKASKAG